MKNLRFFLIIFASLVLHLNINAEVIFEFRLPLDKMYDVDTKEYYDIKPFFEIVNNRFEINSLDQFFYSIEFVMPFNNYEFFSNKRCKWYCSKRPGQGIYMYDKEAWTYYDKNMTVFIRYISHKDLAFESIYVYMIPTDRSEGVYCGYVYAENLKDTWKNIARALRIAFDDIGDEADECPIEGYFK